MLDNTSKWSHARGNTVVPSRWQATTIAPAEAVSAEEIRALVDEIGFDYIARRSHRRPLRGQDARS